MRRSRTRPKRSPTTRSRRVEPGAALIRFHVRDPQTGRWVQDVPYYSEVYRRTRAVCDPLLWPTFPFDGTPAERFSHFVALAKDPGTKPDIGAADMGSVNLATYSRASKKIRGANFVYQNSYETCRYFLEMSRELSLRPTLQIFEPGFLRAALVFLDQGLLTEPLILKFYLGGKEQNFGLPPTLKSLETYLEMVEGVRCNWFAATLGGDNLPLVPLNRKFGRARTGRPGGLSVRTRGSAFESADSRARGRRHPREGPSSRLE
ncbi:MAG TPA: 3-keto-5-aminohexanoate cleavage protein [Candidatus Binataceae bacterium]|nr:3-keto-5-aminohexanoate cleavage protein [Candidatus Binataceae bacterium]